MKSLSKLLLISVILSAGACGVKNYSASKPQTITSQLTLVDGYLSMEYKYLQFKTAKGETTYSNEFDTCLTPKGYAWLWDTGGPPSRLVPAFVNQRFNVTFYIDSIFSPENENIKIKGMVIEKMELIK
ncbi:MAG TPA: hypothetical protein VK783_05670 [Bacteroidia bacterium]|jgi:hypothetical protein|nr:hypothetical protein [Bacteroidia bacterium]